MYERFTDRARRVMRFANEEAYRLNHEFIGPEHLLLGLIKDGSGNAARTLMNLNIELHKIRQELEAVMQPGRNMVTWGKLPQTLECKKAVEHAIREAYNLRRDYLGTEHLLLGLLHDEACLPAQVLGKLGLTAQAVREKLVSVPENDTLPADDLSETPGTIWSEFRPGRLARWLRLTVRKIWPFGS